MIHRLPKLPYSYSALEPYIDSLTMKIHHTKHHQAYVDNLNRIIKGKKYLTKLSIEDLLKNIEKVPISIRQSVINNAGGHANHSFFWKIMTPKKTKPSGKLLEVLNSKFGSFQKFKEAFTERAMSLFGSGWTFLIISKDGQIELKRHSFQNSPLTRGATPILAIDLWEHAYYLKYQNRKDNYIKAFWNIVNWEEVNQNLLKALK